MKARSERIIDAACVFVIALVVACAIAAMLKNCQRFSRVELASDTRTSWSGIY